MERARAREQERESESARARARARERETNRGNSQRDVVHARLFPQFQRPGWWRAVGSETLQPAARRNALLLPMVSSSHRRCLRVLQLDLKPTDHSRGYQPRQHEQTGAAWCTRRCPHAPGPSAPCRTAECALRWRSAGVGMVVGGQQSQQHVDVRRVAGDATQGDL